MDRAILSISHLADAAERAVCPGCRVAHEVRRAVAIGAAAKAAAFRKSPAIRKWAGFHTCGVAK